MTGAGHDVNASNVSSAYIAGIAGKAGRDVVRLGLSPFDKLGRGSPGTVRRARTEDWIPAEDAGITGSGWWRRARTGVIDVAMRREDRRNSEWGTTEAQVSVYSSPAPSDSVAPIPYRREKSTRADL